MKWYEKNKGLQGTPKSQPVVSNEPVTKVDVTKVDDTVKETKSFSENTVIEKKEEIRMEEKNTTDRVEEMLKSSSSFEDVTQASAIDDNERNVTTINSKTTFKGNLETGDDVIIYGNVVGDINCDGSISIYGKVQGNIVCHNASFNEADVEGDIICSGQLELSENSILHGNVTAINMENGGHIKGDVKIEETAHFKSKSAIIGNITSLEIEIDRGCIIQGNIAITEKIDL